MSFKPPFTYINAQETAKLVKENPTDKVQVVDVRDDDFAGGNIVGAANHPSAQLEGTVEEMVKKYAEVPKIIFHCALSQVRGPKSARIYSEALQRLNPDSKQQVLVLRDGFTGFQQQFRDDPKLVEKFNKMYHD